MCVAIYKPEGIIVDDEKSRKDFELAFEENNDGAGFAFRLEPGKLRVHKGFFRFEDLWDAWQVVQGAEAVLHFRWASAGAISHENCHPFIVPKRGVLIHNGHFAGYGTTNAESDTKMWVEKLLKPLLAKYPDAMGDKVMLSLLEDAMGANKVVYLPTVGHSVIFNEELGKWDGGVWYSNLTYRSSWKKNTYVKGAKTTYVVRGNAVVPVTPTAATGATPATTTGTGGVTRVGFQTPPPHSAPTVPKQIPISTPPPAAATTPKPSGATEEEDEDDDSQARYLMSRSSEEEYDRLYGARADDGWPEEACEVCGASATVHLCDFCHASGGKYSFE